MKMRRTISRVSRPLTALVGSVFLFSAVIAQLAFCQCGIFCPHAARQAAQEVAEAAPEAAHSCCSPEGQDDAPATSIAEDKPSGEEHGCPCPVQIASSEKDLPPGLMPVAASPVHDDGAFDALPAANAIKLPLVEIATAPTWRPVRGSPGTGPPVHLLNSVFLI
jgi:hypothetical protein